MFERNFITFYTAEAEMLLVFVRLTFPHSLLLIIREQSDPLMSLNTGNLRHYAR